LRHEVGESHGLRLARAERLGGDAAVAEPVGPDKIAAAATAAAARAGRREFHRRGSLASDRTAFVRWVRDGEIVPGVTDRIPPAFHFRAPARAARPRLAPLGALPAKWRTGTRATSCAGALRGEGPRWGRTARFRRVLVLVPRQHLPQPVRRGHAAGRAGCRTCGCAPGGCTRRRADPQPRRTRRRFAQRRAHGRLAPQPAHRVERASGRRLARLGRPSAL
jgi:hypothetical protein